jgi:hypothetical protein
MLKAVRKLENDPVDFTQLQTLVPTKMTMQMVENWKGDISKLTTPVCLMWSVFFHGNPTARRHWTLLWRNRTGVHFFDPLGFSWQQLFKKTHEPHKGLFQQFKAHRVKSSLHKLQKSSAVVSDCGYHIAIRSLFLEKSANEYARFIKQSGMSPDDTVGFLCYVNRRFPRK